MAENAVCPKAMLILLLCHLQVYPLCSNAPAEHGGRIDIRDP